MPARPDSAPARPTGAPDPGTPGPMAPDAEIPGSAAPDAVALGSAARQFRDEGYAIFERVIPWPHLAALRDECGRFIRMKNAEMDAAGTDVLDLNHRGKRYFISECLFRSQPLARWAFSDVMAQIAGALLGPQAYLFVDQYVVKAGAAAGQAGMTFSWHQDSGYLGYPHPAYLTCWCALDDITEDNGTVYLLPYSLAGTAGLVHHVRDEQTNDLVADVHSQAGVPAVVPAESIVCFSSYLLHSSGANHTGRMRRVYLLQYSPSPIVARDGRALARHAVPFLHASRNVADPAAPADVPVAG
jgi:ectoine hydroxylase-related dioxygenase (phytanoyl-CoA dioxygenase family)